jgi:hypothetical protein
MQQKVIARVALFRRGIRLFEESVNRHMAQGWKLSSLDMGRMGFLRMLCVAHLVKPLGCCEEEG